MAKELPFYKHEPSEWLEGEIQVCTDAAIVCFTNLRDGYWLKLGCMSYAFALQKYCRRDASILQELIQNGIVDLEGDYIRIKFLDLQLEEFNSVSEKRKKAAAKRWENANGMQVHSKSNAIREEKRREEEIREEENIDLLEKEPKEKRFNFKAALLQENFDPKLVEDWIKVRKVKRAANTETSFKMFLNQIHEAERRFHKDRNELLELTVSRSWQSFKVEYIENLNSQNGSTKQQPTNAISREDGKEIAFRRAMGLD